MTDNLVPVTDLGGQPVTPPREPLPEFEGITPESLVVQVSGMTKLDLESPVFGVDDRIHASVVFRCVGVDHRLDKDGNLQRRMVIKPVEMKIVPFIPNEDDGVLYIRDLV